ncbi:MAG: hypothetical protein WCS95_10025 [Lentisphaeria bacterium]
MLKVFVACFVFMLVFVGCQATSFPQANLHAIDKQQSAVPRKITTAKKVDFSPKYISKLSDKYPDALNIYDSSPKPPQGVYLYEELIFVVVTIDTNKENIKYLEGTAMLRVIALLREKYPSLPPRFKVKSRVLENKLYDETGLYRYAIACKAAELEAKSGQDN